MPSLIISSSKEISSLWEHNRTCQLQDKREQACIRVRWAVRTKRKIQMYRRIHSNNHQCEYRSIHLSLSVSSSKSKSKAKMTRFRSLSHADNHLKPVPQAQWAQRRQRQRSQWRRKQGKSWDELMPFSSSSAKESTR